MIERSQLLDPMAGSTSKSLYNIIDGLYNRTYTLPPANVEKYIKKISLKKSEIMKICENQDSERNLWHQMLRNNFQFVLLVV